MTSIAVHNTTDQPQVVTDAGQIVGAGEFAAIAKPDDRTKALLDAEVLHKVTGDPAGADIDPAAADALRAVTTKPTKES